MRYRASTEDLERGARRADRIVRSSEEGFEQAEGGAQKYSRALGGLTSRLQTAGGMFQRFKRQLSRPATAQINTSGVQQAISNLQKVQQQVDALNEAEAEVGVETDGGATTAARLQGLSLQVDQLNAKSVKIGITLAGAVAAGLAIRGLVNHADLFEESLNRLSNVSTPLFETALSGATGLITAATAALGSLVFELGKGAAGFVAIGGAAGAAAAGGLFVYSRALTSALEGAKLVREELEELAQKQMEQRRLAILNRESVRSYNDQLRSSTIALTHVQAAISDRVLPALTRMMSLWTGLLPQLTPPLYRLVDGLTEVMEGFSRTLSAGREFAQLRMILDFMAEAGWRAGAALSNMALAGLEMASALIPPARRFGYHLLEATNRVTDWMRSAEGITTIGAWVRQLERRMYQLLDITGNVARGFGGMFAALAESGAGAALLADLQRVSAAFADVGREGSVAREKIKEFAAAGVPLIRGAASAAAEIARQFFRVADSAVSLRMEGSNLTVLESILQTIERNASTVADVFIREWKKIGPLLPPLIDELTRLFDEFTANSNIIPDYIRALTFLMEQYQNLPAPMQRAIVHTAALNKVMGGSLGGLLGLVGGITQAIAFYKVYDAVLFRLRGQHAFWMRQFMKLGSAAKWFGSALLHPINALKSFGAAVMRVAAPVGRFAATIGSRLLPWISRLAPWLPRLGVGFLALSNPVGWVVTALTLLATAFVMAYRRSETFRNIVNGVAAAVKTFVLSQFSGVVGWFQTNWPLMGQVASTVMLRIRQVVTAVSNAVSAVVRTIWGGISGWFTQNARLMQSAGTSVWTRLRAIVGPILSAIAAVIRTIWGGVVAFWRANNQRILSILRSTWNIFAAIVGTAIRIVGNVIKLGMQLIVGDWRGAWNTLKRIVQLGWQLIKTVTSNFLNVLKQLVLIGWNAIVAITRGIWNNVIVPVFRGAWNLLKAAARAGWNAIRAGVAGAWNWIKDTTATVWNGIKSFFTGWWNSLKNFVSDTAHAIWQRLKDSWNSVKATATSIWNALGDWLRGWWNSARQFISDLAHQIWARLRDSWNLVKDTATNIWDSLGQWLRGWWDTALSFISDKAHSIWARLKDSWNGIKDTAKDLWHSIGDTIKGEINRLLRFIDTLGNAIEFIGGKIGFEVDIPDTKKLARGGVVEMARGGYMDGGTADRGGVGSGRRPVAITNEAGPEAVVPLSRRTPEGQRALEVANRSPNARPHRRGAPEGVPNTKAYAMGGVLGPGGLRYFYSGGATAMKNAVESRWPVTGSTYAGHPGGADSVDFTVTRWGARATGGAKQMGDEIAAYVAPPSTRWTIWYGRINEGGEWAPYRGGPTSGGSSDPQTVAHTDHVHATAYSGGFKGGKGSGPSGGGSRFLSMLPSVPGFGDSGVLGDILSGAGNKLLSAAKDYVLEKANPFAGGGIIPGPAGAPKLTFAEAGERVLPVDLTASFDHLAASIDRWHRRASGGRAVAEGESTEKRNRERRMETLMQENNSRLERLERLVDESPERTGEAVDRAVQSNIAESRDYRDAMERAWESINSRNTLAGRR